MSAHAREGEATADGGSTCADDRGRDDGVRGAGVRGDGGRGDGGRDDGVRGAGGRGDGGRGDGGERARAGPLTFTRLLSVSLVHSCVYTALLVCALAAGKPEPLTRVLGYAHGLLWIAMSLACIAATRLRIVPLRVAVAVAVLGGIGPFAGSFEFIRERSRRR